MVKLCDFGFAHIGDKGDRGDRGYGSGKEHGEGDSKIGKDIVGTLEYLDPEYVQGKVSEFSRDIWALGIVAYELLTGKNPFDGMP